MADVNGSDAMLLGVEASNAARSACIGTTFTCEDISGADRVGASAGHQQDCDLRLICKDGTLPANKCILARASSVLRETLALQLTTPGELPLPSDSAAAWAVALRLLSLQIYPLTLVNFDNLTPLFVLADKYNMPVVRGACAHFLHISASQLQLTAPLTSPANLLTAASLLSNYCSTHPILAAYCATVRERLDVLLAPLQRPPDGGTGAAAAGAAAQDTAAAGAAVVRWQSEVAQLAAQLEGLVGSDDYMKVVCPEVQIKVSLALLSALRRLAGRLPPRCMRCDGPLLPAATCFHENCAAALYTELHTRGCRLCKTPMPPSHARFCNSCAYRRKKA